MSTHAPKRRWSRFSLRGMFLILTAFCVWLGWNVNIVHQRQMARQTFDEEFWDLKGPVKGRPQKKVPWIRQLLGDKPVDKIWPTFPPSQDLTDARAQFPEAEMWIGSEAENRTFPISKREEYRFLRANSKWLLWRYGPQPEGEMFPP